MTADSRSKKKKRRPYATDLMIERRRRLIDAAKHLIADEGADRFTIRTLAQKAGVSITTIYSTYGDKEGVIAAAIEDFYGALPVAQKRAPSSLTGTLREIGVATETILGNQAYSKSLADLYFSRTASGMVHRILQRLAMDTVEPWVEQVLTDGDAIPGLSKEFFCDTLATDRWSVIFEWARGLIANDDFADSTRFAFLVAAAGLTRGATRARVDAAIHRIVMKLSKAAKGGERG